MKTIFAVMLLAAAGFSQTPERVMTDRAAARFLDQATWGPTPESISELTRVGIPDWLGAQFAAEPSGLPDQPLLNAAGNRNTDLGPVQAAFFENTVKGRDQLRQRVAFILSQIWVVSQITVRPAYAFPPYWRIFEEHAFGNYRDIIKAVTLNPAMGTYLNMANNRKANPARGTAANENYARELMQLFTLGLVELNPDGSPVLDGNHEPIPTYNQAVVTNLANALTGWTYPAAPETVSRASNPPYYFGEMIAVESQHDVTSKTIFNNITIPAGQTAQQDLESVLDALMAHPSLAPFVSKQLIQHLVTSNPSPAYVERVSQVFTSTQGDMKSVLIAILTDPEAREGDSPEADVNTAFGHLREPILLMANLARGLNATIGPENRLNRSSAALGQNLFNAPSVFSYFSPLSRISGGLLGPEFQIHSTQTAAGRANLVNTALYGRLDNTTTLDLTPFVSRAGNLDELLDYISYVFVHSGMSPALRQAAREAAEAAGTPRAKAQAALYIVLTSSEYQVIQ
ncbi:MAG: DUF1800 domain-containing protein [Bryobacterales bacterium]|nr:DUF1800 domain-containing protein [Bryobacterales bacterium]